MENNVAQEVKKKIRELKDKRNQELLEIATRITEEENKLEAARLEQKEATGELDLDTYEKATKTADRASVALKMYRERHKQLTHQDFVTEEESNKVIASILAYEEELEGELKAAMRGPLQELASLQSEYETALYVAEDTLKTWEREIHANYISKTTTYKDGTNRSPVPVPVHNGFYNGCPEAVQLREYLQKCQSIYK